MTAKTFSRSFAGGEISPLLYGRLDLAKNQTGLALAQNFLITPQGPAENRPGFAYVNRAKDTATPPALIPFTYNSQQSFALEFGNGYIRFHTQGGTLLEASKAITGVSAANPGVVTVVGHGYTTGQWVFVQGVNGTSGDILNGRFFPVVVLTADTFNLLNLTGGTVVTTGLTYTGGGTVSRVYEIASPYAAADLYDLHYVQSADVLTIVHQGYAPRELRRLGATNWTLTTISFAPTIATPGALSLTDGGPGGGTPTNHNYVHTALAQTTLEESLPSIGASDTWDLTVAGNYIDIDVSATGTVPGAVRYNIYKLKNGIFGFIGQNDGTTFRDNNIEPDLAKTPPVLNAPFAGDYPRAVSYYEQRRCFAGTGNLPQTVWTTRSATERNLSYSIPTQDDDAITARIVAREAQTVRHLVPFNDLIALTSGGVWRITSSDGGPLTPATFSVKPQSYVGASNVQPVVTNSSIIYAPDRGAHVRELGYKWEVQSYQAEDVSVLAPHLVDFRTITQMAYAKCPYQIVWAVRDDGVLLGMTHQPEHEVKAWHRHTTQGAFKSVCAIPEGAEDGVYALVQRHVLGQDFFYIERMHTRQFATLGDAFFVDSGVTYNGAPATTFSVWHLDGLQVSILADGGVHPPRTVTSGKITLVSPASKVQIGLPYNCDAQTIPLAMETAAAFGQGIPKNINKAWLSVYNSGAGIKVGPQFTKLREIPARTVADPYGSPPALKSGIAEIAPDPMWQQDGSVCVRQDNPLPLTLRALALEVATGG